MGDEGLDLCPVDNLPGLDHMAQPAWQQPPQDGTRAGVHAYHVPGRTGIGQLYLVGPYEAGSLQVDQVPGTQVLGQQDFAGAALEGTEVFRVEANTGRVVAQVLDLVRVGEPVLAVVIDHEPGHRRVPGPGQVFAGQPCDDVDEAANMLFRRPHYGDA